MTMFLNLPLTEQQPFVLLHQRREDGEIHTAGTTRTMSVSDPTSLPNTGPNVVQVEVMRNNSELFRAQCMKLMLESERACKRMQAENKERLDQRIRDIQFLKTQLELKLEEIIVEIDVLVALQNRVAKALEACTDPLRVTLQCVEERMKRPPSERLQDQVDNELLKERQAIEGVASLLQRVIEQIIEQIRLNRSAKYHLEKDLKEKFEAQSIDNSCTVMTTHTITNQQTSRNTNTVPSSSLVTPKEWENTSNVTMAKAEQQKTNSGSLRALVESVLEQTASDLQRQVQATAAAFQLKVQGIKAVKSQMEEQLSKIQAEFSSQERITEDLLVAIKENQHFLSLAQARLDLQRQKPRKEQCHDQTHSQLLAEVQQLVANITKLQEAVTQSQEEQRMLLRFQRELQENIELKASALYIDEVICVQLRETIIIHNL